MSEHYPKSKALFERAVEVIPGGIYGHTSPAATLPLQSPYYAARGEGCRYWDVDGNAYIDYMCGYGPILLGYNHPEIEAVAAEQRSLGNCFNHPTEHMVTLAERLVSLVDFADWSVFAKNGSDVTAWAIKVAREHTGRKKILCIKNAYHGIDAWCSPRKGGVIEEDREHIHAFPWNDLNVFKSLIQRYRGEIAAFIATPFHHPTFADCRLPAPGFFEGIQEICREEGIVFVLDDIRAGFRLHIGGSHRHFGFEPDLICFCKALGNGYPISAALGRESLKLAASRVFLTGSYWNSAVPMVVALKVLELIERDDLIQQMEARGRQLTEGLVALGEKYDCPIKPSGVPAVPFFRFAEESNFLRWQAFCAEAMKAGLFFHPHHNWFVSAAHTEADVAETLERAEGVFKQGAF